MLSLTLSDEELISRLREGKDKAFDILYIRYRQRMVATAVQRLKNQPAAEELVQDIMTDIWQRRAQLVIQTNFSVYIFSALRYAVLDYIRKSAAKDQYIKEMLAIASVSFEENVPSATDMEVLYNRLEYCVDALPDKCKAVFKLSRLENKSVIEISNQLGISVDTTKYHIATAMKILRSDFRHVPIIVLWLTCNMN